ncbi:MAG: hypothetical protein KAH33_05475 [Candidatus Delongbacteria bacterium]|nr:hypothetical protein [Candidatus Delongbacteria bacterium]
MKNIILISLLIVISISFSQTLKNKKCDSLKTAYEAKIEEWRSIENKIKNESEKNRYDSLILKYNKAWEEYYPIKKNFLTCIEDTLKMKHLKNYPPPHHHLCIQLAKTKG